MVTFKCELRSVFCETLQLLIGTTFSVCLLIRCRWVWELHQCLHINTGNGSGNDIINYISTFLKLEFGPISYRVITNNEKH